MPLVARGGDRFGIGSAREEPYTRVRDWLGDEAYASAMSALGETPVIDV